MVRKFKLSAGFPTSAPTARNAANLNFTSLQEIYTHTSQESNF